MKITSLHLYPVKSMRGLDVRYAEVKQRGLRGDRRWMLVDKNGRFITQREKSNMAQIKVKLLREGGLKLTIPNQAPIIVEEPETNERLSAQVWKSTVNAVKAEGEVNEALSDFFDNPVSLVFMDAEAERLANEKYTPEPTPVSFADGYPILIANEASLRALNKHIEMAGGDAVPMNRFRPNIVVDGDEAWTEDTWKQVKIGDVVLDLVKPCTRCVTTTIDQVSGLKMGKEPIQTLKKRRLSKDPEIKGVLFGWNAVPRTLGRIGVGDEVSV
jgi:uncharacterized protein YcbX